MTVLPSQFGATSVSPSRSTTPLPALITYIANLQYVTEKQLHLVQKK